MPGKLMFFPRGLGTINNSKYLNNISKIKLLSRERERALKNKKVI
jgi:hypothetical protein